MTRFIVLSLFPEMFDLFLNTSIIKRAIDKKILSVELVDIRKFSNNKHNKVDDTPYGGGNGMVLMCEPLDKAIIYAKDKLKNDNIKIVYLSPRGKLLNYNLVKSLSDDYTDYILICGHYEGIDERIIEKHKICEISIGDYVLTGGELPAMVMIDTIARQKPGVLSTGSLDDESHTNILLEYPQYTKPVNYDNMSVPDVLISGNHAKISEYRKKESILKTYSNRYDLIKKALDENLITQKEIDNILNQKGGK